LQRIFFVHCFLRQAQVKVSIGGGEYESSLVSWAELGLCPFLVQTNMHGLMMEIKDNTGGMVVVARCRFARLLTLVMQVFVGVPIRTMAR
jgi:hypothetical protein